MRLIILLALLTFGVDAEAQFHYTWIRTERDTPVFSGVNQIEDMVIDNDGFIYVNGTIDTLQNTAPVFICYDSTGEEMWRNTIAQLNLDFSWRMFLTPARHIICAGHYEDNSGTNNMIYVEFNTTGDSIGGGILNSPGFATGDDLQDACIDHSGNIYMAGQIRLGNDFPAAVCRFDTGSNFRWLSSFPLLPGWNSGDVRGIEMCGDTALYCTAFNFTGKASLLFCDSAGTFKWNRELSLQINDYHTSLAKDPFGNAIVGGSFQNQLRLEKVSPYGDSLWLTQYSYPGINISTPEILNIQTDAAGNIFTLAASYGQPAYSIISRFDSNGFLQWVDTASGYDHVYGRNKEFFILDNGILTFTTTNSGTRLYRYTTAGQRITDQELILPGIINPEVNSIAYNNGSLYLAGNSFSGFGFRTGFTARLDQETNSVKDLTNEDEIVISPNPAREFITINSQKLNGELNAFEILNESGSLVKKGNLERSRKITVKDLSPGIYYLKVKNLKGKNKIRRFLVY